MQRAAITTVSAVVLAVLACVAASAADKGPTRPRDDFSGKIIVFYQATLTGPPSVLEKVEMRDVGGRVFVMGTRVNTGDKKELGRGCRCALAWDSIEAFDIFDSLEQYRARLSAAGNEN